MPSYPTSVFSPASKNTGETIQPAHVNDLESEVNAVESGLLNGLNHAVTISTGGLTISTGSLNVGGPSTFAGPVVFSSAVSFGANGSFTAPRVPCAKVSASADIAIATDAWTGVSWDTEVYDSTGLHSTATNSSRVNLTSSGLWRVSAFTEWAGNATGGVRLRLMVNDTQCIGAVSDTPRSVPGAVQAVASYLATSTTDYVGLVVVSDGSTRTISNSSLYGGSWLAVERLSG